MCSKSVAETLEDTGVLVMNLLTCILSVYNTTLEMFVYRIEKYLIFGTKRIEMIVP